MEILDLLTIGETNTIAEWSMVFHIINIGILSKHYQNFVIKAGGITHWGKLYYTS